MIVNFARPTGNGLILEPLEVEVVFEGGEPHEGVLATFTLDGREVSGRIIKVSHSTANAVDSELIVTVEQIDQEAEDIGSEEALRSLPPRNDSEENL
jgi:hypothetical protein